MNFWYIYGLLCSDQSIYTGISINVEKRVKIHNSGKGSKYVRSRLPATLLGAHKCANKSEALKLEFIVKRLNPDLKFLYFTETGSELSYKLMQN